MWVSSQRPNEMKERRLRENEEKEKKSVKVSDLKDKGEWDEIDLNEANELCRKRRGAERNASVYFNFRGLFSVTL